MISVCLSHSRLFHGSEIKRAAIYHSVKPSQWLTRYGDHIHYVQSDQVSEIILHICFLQIMWGVPLLFAGSCVLRRSLVLSTTLIQGLTPWFLLRCLGVTVQLQGASEVDLWKICQTSRRTCDACFFQIQWTEREHRKTLSKKHQGCLQFLDA